MIVYTRTLQAPPVDPPSQKRKEVMIAEVLKYCKSTPPIDAPLIHGSSRPTSLIHNEQKIMPMNPSARGSRSLSNTTPSVPFVKAVKGVLAGAQRPSIASLQGKVWAAFDATAQVDCFLI